MWLIHDARDNGSPFPSHCWITSWIGLGKAGKQPHELLRTLWFGCLGPPPCTTGGWEVPISTPLAVKPVGLSTLSVGDGFRATLFAHLASCPAIATLPRDQVELTTCVIVKDSCKDKDGKWWPLSIAVRKEEGKVTNVDVGTVVAKFKRGRYGGSKHFPFMARVRGRFILGAFD